VGGVRQRGARGRRGEQVEPGEAVRPVVEVEELGRVELRVGAVRGYSLVGGERRPLPVGSRLKGGVFYWQLGAGFLGDFQLVFEKPDRSEVRTRVRVQPKVYVVR
jgi:hypothetical protein